jgi:dienelactone hydrolase
MRPVCTLPRHSLAFGAKQLWRLRRGLVAVLALCATHVPGSPAAGATGPQPARFDLGAIQRRDDLDARERPGSCRPALGVRVCEVSFASRAWDERGQSQTIRLRAYVTSPLVREPARRLPAVVSAHGLGAHAEWEPAVEITRNLDAVALTISAPGVGGSEGSGPTAEDPRPIFRAGSDVRQSWVYQYAYGIMRAVTYLETRDDVDPQAIVATGFSMGGIATFIVGGTDARIRGILPVSATGGLARAAAEDTWFRRLVLAAGGLKPSDPGPRALFRSLDPLLFAARIRGAAYLLVGAQDEFFPLDQVVATWNALRARDRTLVVLPDYDHGWYFGEGCPAACMPGGASVGVGQPGGEAGRPACPAAPICPTRCPAGQTPPYCGPQVSYNAHDEFTGHWVLLLRQLLAHVAHPPRSAPRLPPLPFIQRVRTQVVVRTATDPRPRRVRLSVSEDGGYTFVHHELALEPDGAWHLRRAVSPRAVLVAELETEEGAHVTSVPMLPRSFAPRVRAFGAAPSPAQPTPPPPGVGAQ